MKGQSILRFLVVASLGGCAIFLPSEDNDYAASEIMKTADSLAAASFFDEAAMRFAEVADLHPASSSAPQALLRTAILSGHPRNRARNDSTSLVRLSQYASLPLASADRQRVEFEASLLQRVMADGREVIQMRASLDSLAAASGQQAAALQTRSAKIRELETQLADANTELKKLREIDVTLSKRATKK